MVAHYRKAKLESSILQFLSETISFRLQDPRIAPITTITRVEMSQDYQFAKVYFTIHGNDADCRKTHRGLVHATPHLQRLLAGHLHIRQVPRISFEIDKGAREARRTMELLALNQQEREAREALRGEEDAVEATADDEGVEAGFMESPPEPSDHGTHDPELGGWIDAAEGAEMTGDDGSPEAARRGNEHPGRSEPHDPAGSGPT